MARKKEPVTLAEMAALHRRIAELLEELDAARQKANESVRGWGFDPTLPPRKAPKRRKAGAFRKNAKKKPAAKRRDPKNDPILGTIKLKGKGVQSVHDAGYKTFRQLNGVSKEALRAIPGVGAGIIAILEHELKKRGMAFADD